MAFKRKPKASPFSPKQQAFTDGSTKATPAGPDVPKVRKRKPKPAPTPGNGKPSSLPPDPTIPQPF